MSDAPSQLLDYPFIDDVRWIGLPVSSSHTVVSNL